MALRWLRALLWLVVACQAGVASVAHPAPLVSRPPRQPDNSVRLNVEIGKERTEFGIIVRTRLNESEAANQFREKLSRAKLGDHACQVLARVRLQDAPVCAWIPLSMQTGQPRQEINLSKEFGEIHLRFALQNDGLFLPSNVLTIETGPLGPEQFHLRMLVRRPYAVAGVEPLPNSLGQGRLSYERNLRPQDSLRVRLHLERSFIVPQLNDDAQTSLLEQVRQEDARKKVRLSWIYISALMGIVGLILPSLFLMGLLYRLPTGNPVMRQQKRARRLTFVLALLCASPLPGYGLAVVNLVNPTVTEVFQHYLLDFDLAWWTARVLGALYSGLLLCVFLWAIQQTCRRIGLPHRLPWLALPVAVVLFGAVSAALLVSLGSMQNMPGPGSAPIEVDLTILIVTAVPLLVWIVRASLRLLGLGPGMALGTAVGVTLSLLPWRGWPVWGSAAEAFVAFLLYYLQPLAAVGVFIPFIWLLRQLGHRRVLTGRLHMAHFAGGALLAACLLPRSFGWSELVAALVAILVVWPRLALSPRPAAEARAEWLPTVLADLPAWVERLERAAALKSASRRARLDNKLSEGEMSPGAWSRRRKALEAARDQAVDEVHLPGSLYVRDVVLGTSVERNPWRSGLRALAYGAPMVVALTALRIFQAESVEPSPAPVLAWLSTFVPPAAKMAASTFLLGYYFDRLRGGTGLHKALWLATSLCVAEGIIWLPELAQANAIAASAWTCSQHFLLLIPVGVLAFDYARMRQVEAHGFDWRRFSWFGDPRLLSTGIAASLAALGPTVATLFSGTFASAVKDVVTAVAPTFNAG